MCCPRLETLLCAPRIARNSDQFPSYKTRPRPDELLSRAKYWKDYQAAALVILNNLTATYTRRPTDPSFPQTVKYLQRRVYPTVCTIRVQRKLQLHENLLKTLLSYSHAVQIQFRIPCVTFCFLCSNILLLELNKKEP